MAALNRVLGPFSLIFGALTVLALVASGLLYVLLPELQQASTGMLAVAGVLAVFYVLSSLNGIRDALVGRQTRFGVNTLVMVVAFIGIVGLVNYLGTRIHHRFDTTASG
ncbi:MAG: hypothetical protein NTZ05_20040 [Chloroflexi bacterium]|nr:hypothetical protein [Chloroflexota bacterium]